MITAKEVKDFRIRAEKHAEEMADNFLNEHEARLMPLISNFLLDQAMNGKKHVYYYAISSNLAEKIPDYKELPLYASKKLNEKIKNTLESCNFRIDDDIIFWG